MVLLEAFSCSRPWLFDPLEVSSIVIIVDVGEEIATMQPIVAMCMGRRKRLLPSASASEGSGGILWGDAIMERTRRRSLVFNALDGAMVGTDVLRF